MNWLWPQNLRTDPTALVRLARAIHCVVLGFAVILVAISIGVLINGRETNPVAYLTVGLIWLGVALIGRSVRYVLARE